MLDVAVKEQERIAGLRTHRRTLLVLGLACGIGVANIYYNQPLLLEMSRSFHVAAARTGTLAVATQLGYAAGILLLVPLADVLERRALMVRLFACVAVSMLVAAVAPALGILLLASVAVGLTAAVTHVAVPIAPELADPAERGRALGVVMTGLLLGILLARSFAGTLGAWLGWRSVFYAGAALNLSMVPVLLWALPALPPPHPVSYGRALRSLWMLFRREPLLRESAVLSALVFASFSCFWTTLAFLLGTPRYHMGPGVVGSFGILGASGALIAPVAGRMADRRGARAVITLALVLLTAAFAVLWGFGYHIAGLVAGVVLLDLGAQANQLGNQTRIFGLDPTARGRINTIYMTIYFLGGSLGSLGASLAWERARWPGVCALGLGFAALAALRHGTGMRSRSHAV